MKILIEIIGVPFVIAAFGFGAFKIAQVFARGLASKPTPTNNDTKGT
jgi:hypothetical protein